MQTKFTTHSETLVTCAIIGEGGLADATGEGATRREALINALCDLGWDYAEAEDYAGRAGL